MKYDFDFGSDDSRFKKDGFGVRSGRLWPPAWLICLTVLPGLAGGAFVLYLLWRLVGWVTTGT